MAAFALIERFIARKDAVETQDDIVDPSLLHPREACDRHSQSNRRLDHGWLHY